MSYKGDYLSFELADFLFGISTQEVLELNKNLHLTPVPKSTSHLRGITNLRGQIVPVIDMYERLKLGDHPNKNESISVILRCTGIVIALLVDNIGQILPLDEDSFESPPNNFSPVLKELIIGVHKLPDRLLHILDGQKIIGGLKATRELPFNKEIIKGIDIHRNLQINGPARP